MKPVQPFTYTISTPEHVPLSFTLASVGSRFLALFLDALFVSLSFAVLILLCWLALPVLLEGGYLLSLLGLVLFLLRNFYFAFAEMRWRGQTLGKRLVKIRVVARDGGSLTPEIIFARNLTRELELFIPVVVLAGGEAIGDSPVVRFLCLGWLLIVVLLPLLNKDRMRVGDLIAGTIVIETPRTTLLPDLVQTQERELTFTDHQLSIYGIKELQALEDVLRLDDARPNEALLDSVAERIQRKIQWRGPHASSERFLRAFYTAQRKRLEKDMLFGKRKEEKS